MLTILLALCQRELRLGIKTGIKRKLVYIKYSLLPLAMPEGRASCEVYS